MAVGRTRRWARTAAVLGVTLAAALATACTPDAGAHARDQLAREMREQVGEYFIDVTGRASDDMPGPGHLDGEVELRADTPAEVFVQALSVLEAFEPEGRVSYRPVGVRANGVTVCVDDPQREGMLSLRERLRQAGQTLQGQWTCGTPSTERPPGYRGTLTAFVADTERVRPLLHQDRDPLHVTLAGELSRPGGSLGGSWGEVPPTLGPTMDFLEARHDVVRMQLDGPVLRVAVDPVQDLSGTEEAVVEVAGDLDVRLYQGVIDDTGQQSYADFGPLADRLRALAGVQRVQVRGSRMEVRVQEVAAARVAHDLVIDADPPGLTLLEIVVPSAEGRVGEESTYKRHATSEGGHIDLFATLVAEPEVARTTMVEESAVQQQWLQIKVRTSVEETLPLLRGVLPDGIRATFFGEGPGRSVTVAIRDRLTAEDFSATRLDVSARQRLAELWNAAG